MAETQVVAVAADTAQQTTRWPTRKLGAATLGTMGLSVLMTDAIKESWPQIAPAAVAGPAMTTFVGAAIPALVSAAIAYFFVKDAPNTPEFKLLAPPVPPEVPAVLPQPVKQEN